ncbi:MAG: polysaccharide deacetylase family protein [Candidatus Sulfotelmatobacter sp.]
MIKIAQKRVLRSIFSLKGNFAPGATPGKRVFDGIEIAPFWNACSAAVSISADFELNWAFRGRSAELRDQLGTTERRNVPYILDLLSEFSVPITWATVGHLFLASCACEGETAHRNMPRPPFNERWRGDWYKHDPCTDLTRNPLWYAPDLIEQVMRAKVGHEVGSHSFSHIDFSPQTSNPELVEREIEECLAAMAPLGLKLRSLVYPFNHMGHSYHDLLHKFGIIAVRHRDERIRLSYPERSASGVYKIYESMNLRSANRYHYRDKAELFIDHAEEQGASYHLWFHPSDPRSVFQKEFYEILQIIQRQREAGNIWVATMGDLASYCEARECISLQSKSERDQRTIQIRSSLNTEKYGIPEVTLVVPAKTMPKRIRRQIGATSLETAPDAECTRRNGALILNVPAVTQTITLSF